MSLWLVRRTIQSLCLNRSNGWFHWGSLDWRGSSASFHGCGRCTEAWWANFNGNALLVSTETTVLIVGNADSLFLWYTLGVLSRSLSLSEVNSLEDRDGTLDGECPVLCLNGKSGMCSFSAFAAICLANLVVLSVGGGSQLLDLSSFNVLLVALAESCSEAWELVEGAGAGDIERGEVEALSAHVALAVCVSWSHIAWTKVADLGLSEVLGSLLTEAGLEGVLGCSGDNTGEEGEEDDLH